MIHSRFARASALVTLAAALMLGASSCDSPTSDVPRGAFGAVNDYFLDNVLVNMTGLLRDDVQGMVVTGIRGPKITGGQVPDTPGTVMALALFEEDDQAISMSSLQFNDAPLSFIPDIPPPHYKQEFAESPSLTHGTNVRWTITGPTGQTAHDTATLPPPFGTVTFSSGLTLSLDRLSKGDSLTVSWTNTLVDERAVAILEWIPPDLNQIEGISPVPLSIILYDDPNETTSISRFTLTGAQILGMNLPPRGELLVHLYRGSYRATKQYDGGKRLGTFVYAETRAAVRITP